MKIRLIQIAVMAGLVGCSAPTKNDGKNADEADGKDTSGSGSDEDLFVEDDVPADSTGAQVPVRLTFASNTSQDGLSLVEGDDAQDSGAGSGDASGSGDGSGSASDEGEVDSTDAADGSTDAEVDDTPTTTDVAAGGSIQVSDKITLSMARFNIWGIKLKSTKEQKEKEKEVEKKDMEDEKSGVAEHDAAAGEEVATEDGSSELKGPGQDGGKKPHEHREKIAGKRDELKQKDEERDEREAKRDRNMKFRGPYIFDGIKGELEGDAPEVNLADGSYRRIEFKLKRNMTLDPTDPLFGNVFVIQGEFVNGEATVPFEVSAHMSMNFRLRGENPFTAVDGANSLAIVFDLVKWFDGIDLSTAEVSDDGVVFVNKKSNREILKAIRRNIKQATRFGKDADGDGKLAPTETAGAGEDTPEVED